MSSLLIHSLPSALPPSLTAVAFHRSSGSSILCFSFDVLCRFSLDPLFILSLPSSSLLSHHCFLITAFSSLLAVFFSSQFARLNGSKYAACLPPRFSDMSVQSVRLAPTDRLGLGAQRPTLFSSHLRSSHIRSSLIRVSTHSFFLSCVPHPFIHHSLMPHSLMRVITHSCHD
jgi:hypothetical protein